MLAPDLSSDVDDLLPGQLGRIHGRGVIDGALRTEPQAEDVDADRGPQIPAEFAVIEADLDRSCGSDRTGTHEGNPLIQVDAADLETEALGDRHVGPGESTE